MPGLVAGLEVEVLDGEQQQVALEHQDKEIPAELDLITARLV
jgi:hypothetical protein